MRILVALIALASFAFSLGACRSSSKPPPFCDTACSGDSIKFRTDHPLKPYVYISVKNCKADTIVWSHSLLATNRKMNFTELTGKEVWVNKDFIAAYFKDTSFVWLRFNDCITGRGFLLKLPFDKGANMSNYTSALNNFDPKYKVDDGLIAYFDNLFIYVQDMQSGKVEKMKLNDTRLEIDFDKVHKTFDSVNITRNKIFVNLLVNDEKRPLEKTISLYELENTKSLD
jgi:hypothetical protein